MGDIYLGDFQGNSTIRFLWSTRDSNGASVTRTVDGTVSVYKDNGLTQTTTGVTDTEDFDGLTGIHACTIATTDAFYASGSDFSVVLSEATIGGQSVNEVLAHFSIENRPVDSVVGSVGSVTGNVGGNVVGTVASVVGNVNGSVNGNVNGSVNSVTQGVAVSSLSTAIYNKIADFVLRRNFFNAAGSSDGDTKSFRSLLGVVAKLTNRMAFIGTSLVVYEDDDSTILGTQVATMEVITDNERITELDTS